MKGRVYFNNRRTSIDCLIRDISTTGAKLTFASAITMPDIVELHIPVKEETRRVQIQWRRGDEVGVAFITDEVAATLVPDMAALSLPERVAKLEDEVGKLRRMLTELRTELRLKQGSEH